VRLTVPQVGQRRWNLFVDELHVLSEPVEDGAVVGTGKEGEGSTALIFSIKQQPRVVLGVGVNVLGDDAEEMVVGHQPRMGGNPDDGRPVCAPELREEIVCSSRQPSLPHGSICRRPRHQRQEHNATDIKALVLASRLGPQL